VALKKVNPNRMELMKLKKRLRLAVRGHKLMKDKFDELLRQFYDLAKEVYRKRKQLEPELLKAYATWARAFYSHEAGLAVEIAGKIERELRVKRVPLRRMGVEEVNFEIEEKTAGTPFVFYGWKPEFLETFNNSPELVKKVIQLAARELTLINLATELERTRRRVNALEQIMIPQLETQIKQVQAKLDELDREARTRVVKVKEMLAEKQNF